MDTPLETAYFGRIFYDLLRRQTMTEHTRDMATYLLSKGHRLWFLMLIAGCETLDSAPRVEIIANQMVTELLPLRATVATMEEPPDLKNHIRNAETTQRPVK